MSGDAVPAKPLSQGFKIPAGMPLLETHQQVFDMSSRPAPGKTPFLSFFAFVFAFGWEGPVIISIGLGNDSTVEILMGLLFTIFFWSLFGIGLLSKLLKHVFKLNPPEDALAPPAPAKTEQ